MGRSDPTFELRRMVVLVVAAAVMASGMGLLYATFERHRGAVQTVVPTVVEDLPPRLARREPKPGVVPPEPQEGPQELHIRFSAPDGNATPQRISFSKETVARVGDFDERVRRLAALVQSGQFAQARTTLDEIVQVAGDLDRPSFQKLREHLLRRWAESLRQSGKDAESALVFLDLDALQPEDHSHYVGLGLAALAAGDRERAYTYLRRRWEETGEATGFSFELAELCYARNDFECTEKILQPELAGPLAERARRLLAKIKKESAVEGGFRGLVGDEEGNFTISFDGSQNVEAAYGARVILEQARHDVGRQLDFTPDDRVGVVLYTRIQYNMALNAPDWSGALYDGKIRLPTGGMGSSALSLRDTIYHEYTHAVIHRMGGNDVPAWLHEGLAQMMEPGETQYRYQSFQVARYPAIPFSSLDAGFSRFSGPLVSAAYKQSQSFVGYLLAQYGSFRKIRQLLSNFQSGLSPAEALLRTYGVGQAALETQWRQNLARTNSP